MTAEQKILVFLNIISFENDFNLPDSLGEDIGELCKKSKLFSSKEKICIYLLPANLKKDKKTILIYLPKSKKVNYGNELYTFKTLLIQNFLGLGINIRTDDIVFAYKDEAEIAELLKKFYAKEQDKTYMNNEDSLKQANENYFEVKARQFIPQIPKYSFDRVILPSEVIKKIQHAISILKYENKVFNEWGLYEIQPHPSSSLSFYGPSGTGKTMTAEAVAQALGKKILKVSYADVESKYHGEGPKMVKSIFLAAQNNDAVLFFDEADSLLSKRLTNVTQGSEQAINSMRSQLLICLEEYHGIVIFATNLVENYDKAFLTRLISIEFPIPDAETRKKIWDVHIKPINSNSKKIRIPLSSDVDTYELSCKYEFVGREIRNAVINACINVAMEEREFVNQADFINACDGIVNEKQALIKLRGNDAVVFDKDELKSKLVEKMQN